MATVLCNQEAPQEQGFLSFLESLPEKAATTFRFFERSDYYTVHGSDAIFVSKEVFKTPSVIKYLKSGSKSVESVCLSKMNFESLIKDLLLVRQYRIEIYQNKRSGKSQEWTLEYKASPGNLTQLEEVLFGSGGGGSDLVDSKGVMAIKLGTDNQQQIIGVAFGDAILRKFIVCEFPDNESFSNLQALFVQLSPKECLLATSDTHPLTPKLKELIKRNDILLSDCKPGDFNAKDIVQDLNRLLKFKKGTQSQSSMLEEMDLKLAIAGVAAIIKYFELLRDENNFGHFTLSTFNLKQYMRLDMAAVRALQLFPLSAEENKNHSLLGLLNKCRTSAGQRLLAQWIKQPLVDVNKIEERLNIVESFVNDTELRQALYEDHLRKIPDLQRLSKKFQTKKANLQDCYKVYLMLNNLPYLCTCLSKHEGPHAPALKEMFYDQLKELMDDFSKFEEMVKTTIDLDQVENGEFMVKPDFDQDLADLREQMEEVQQSIGCQLNKVAKDLGLEADKSVKLENCSQIGYYFRVTRKEEKALRNKKNYFTIDTKQNGVRFHNVALKDLNEKYLSIRSDYEEHQESVVKLIIEIAAGYSYPMYQLGDVISHLDVLVSFALAAFGAPKPYVRPKLVEKGQGIIKLKQARHPCLEVQEQIDFIPNDVSLDKDNKNFFIITGPNMGGKSTFIRSVALNVLMAQIGSFVACDEAEVAVVDALLARVGAGDKQIKGVSTFMAEMLEVASILKSASSDSLIIIDELGRGTSTYDGFGLAWAISEHTVKNIKAHCLFATHFHELTALADEVKTVGNLQVTAVTSEENITFLYRVKHGICDQSFGIHVAEMAHFPKSVIGFAKEKVKEFEEFQANVESLSKDDEPCAKKSKTVHEEAGHLVQNFLDEVKKIDCDSVSEEEVMAKLNEMKMSMKSSDNPLIQELLSRCS